MAARTDRPKRRKKKSFFCLSSSGLRIWPSRKFLRISRISAFFCSDAIKDFQIDSRPLKNTVHITARKGEEGLSLRNLSKEGSTFYPFLLSEVLQGNQEKLMGLKAFLPDRSRIREIISHYSIPRVQEKESLRRRHSYRTLLRVSFETTHPGQPTDHSVLSRRIQTFP